ncbi:phage virion morphogenesis protein [Devosia sp. J2-20]|uniref:phage virion morphogenesis protein n=1 Tax=Devosia sp. J2-20 TaxID=3026161 RepID=UPI00249BED39|nr:phage virion morphogenesis protein [Devosia sp. J2-20]WDR00748.1 phage virion morphogenesis protein [Devosia sp. J2-20]
MAGVSFSIDDSDALDALGRIERAASNPVEAFHRLGAHFVFSTHRAFETETGPDGRKWKPLSPRTAAKRVGRGRRRGFDHILRLSGRLQQSVSYDVLPNGLEWGSNLAYARIHQLGGTITMPARTATVHLKNIRRKGNRFVRPGTKNAQSRVAAIAGHKVNMPARPFLGISAYDREQVPLIIADYLREEAGQ